MLFIGGVVIYAHSYAFLLHLKRYSWACIVWLITGHATEKFQRAMAPTKGTFKFR